MTITAETPITLESIGRTFLTLVMISEQLGHSTPLGSLDYLHPSMPEPATDFLNWCAQGPGWEASRDRLIQLRHLMQIKPPFMT